MSGLPKRTQMRDLYNALRLIGQHEEIVSLAELHALEPGKIATRIDNDFARVADYEPLPGRAIGSSRGRLPASFDLRALKRTPEFAAALGATSLHSVDERPELAFSYLEREVSPLRGSGLERRYMDLLLLNDDGTPILGELKIGTDSLPYTALIQLLMHFVELSSHPQRQRLVDLGVPEECCDRPFDLYLLGYGTPNKTFHRRAMDATTTIARALMKHDALNGQLRRIVLAREGTERPARFRGVPAR